MNFLINPQDIISLNSHMCKGKGRGEDIPRSVSYSYNKDSTQYSSPCPTPLPHSRLLSSSPFHQHPPPPIHSIPRSRRPHSHLRLGLLLGYWLWGCLARRCRGRSLLLLGLRGGLGRVGWGRRKGRRGESGVYWGAFRWIRGWVGRDVLGVGRVSAFEEVYSFTAMILALCNW